MRVRITKRPDGGAVLKFIRVVGTLDAERASGARWSAADFNDSAARLAANGHRSAPRRLSDDELERIRSRRAQLFALWTDLEAGGTLELTFP